MHGSDEEVDDPPEAGSDEDCSDDGDKQAHEKVDLACRLKYLKFVYTLMN